MKDWKDQLDLDSIDLTRFNSITKLNKEEMINLQFEIQKIHSQFGTTEMANYRIQLLAERYAKEYHKSELKKNIVTDVSGEIETLVNFLLHLNEKDLINNHDFDYEKEAKKYVKTKTTEKK